MMNLCQTRYQSPVRVESEEEELGLDLNQLK